jgi:hypothetical protein
VIAPLRDIDKKNIVIVSREAAKSQKKLASRFIGIAAQTFGIVREK